VTEQRYPPRRPEYTERPGRRGTGREPRRTGWQALDDFDQATDTDTDLPPWAVPGSITPHLAARRPARRPHESPAEARDRPGDRAPGGLASGRHGTARPGPAHRGPDPYGDPRAYDEPPGYSRPAGYDEPRGWSPDRDQPGVPFRRDEYGPYDEPDDFGEPVPYAAPGRASRTGAPGREDDGAAPARRLRRPGHGRAAAARRRKSKRRLVTWGAAAVIIVALMAGVAYLTSSGSPATGRQYVTTYQKGEVRTVPSACKVLSVTTLHQVMAGTPRSQPVGGGQGQSECTFTVDIKPAFRVLQIQEQAFGPSLVPSGDGSATANAAWNFGQARQQMSRPAKNSVWPAARFSTVSGLGDQALSTVQVSRGHVLTDRVTVLVRYRNVLIQVQAQAQESGGFGPVPVTALRSAALTAAKDTFAAVRRQPTV
jgi:hypothetical protein